MNHFCIKHYYLQQLHFPEETKESKTAVRKLDKVNSGKIDFYRDFLLGEKEIDFVTRKVKGEDVQLFVINHKGITSLMHKKYLNQHKDRLKSIVVFWVTAITQVALVIIALLAMCQNTDDRETYMKQLEELKQEQKKIILREESKGEEIESLSQALIRLRDSLTNAKIPDTSR